MADDAPVVEIKDVDLWYGDFQALKRISFDGAKGSIIGLIGPNGCGKSTLMKCINRTLRPQAGSINLVGEEIQGKKMSEMARLVANVPTEVTDTFNLTVMELVMMGRYPYVNSLWWESEDDERLVCDALRKFGIDHLRSRRLSELSSGERQRTLIAKAFVQEPTVMLVDEPTSHLDLKFKLEVMEYLSDLARKDMTIIVASHDINLMSRYCDHMVIVREGRLVAEGTPSEVITRELIRDVYEVDSFVGRDEDGNVYILPKCSLGMKE